MLKCSFIEGPILHRLKYGKGRGQNLAKAIGMKANKNRTIVDATAGLGYDAFILASLGANVTLIERSETMHKLVADAMLEAKSHGGEVSKIVSRMSLLFGDSKNILPGLSPRVILIDTIGKLYKSYWYGQIAYIGGGFSKGGVHNVMEPAIAKLPVFFGPNYTKSQEAKQLINAGGGFKINNGNDFYNKIKSLLSNKEQLVKSSFSSKSIIDENLGSSNRVVQGILND